MLGGKPMSLNDDMEIDNTRAEDSELSEKEYSDILGLEGMSGGGEKALDDEPVEDQEEESHAYIIAEQQNHKPKATYRKYSYEDEIEEIESVPKDMGVPLEQLEKWKQSSITEKEAISDEKYASTEYWEYLQTNVSAYARSVQLGNEQLYREVEVAGVSFVNMPFEQLSNEITQKENHVNASQPKINEIPSSQSMNTVREPYQESMQIPLPESYTSPNKTFRQDEMVEVFSYAKKQQESKINPPTFEQAKVNQPREIAQGQSEKTTRDVNVAEKSNAEGQKDTAAEQGKVDIEASIQAHEIKEETQRSFQTSVNMETKAMNVYEQGKTAVSSMTEDDLVSEGHREIEKYTRPMTTSLAVFASRSAISNIKSELEKSSKAVQETVKKVIRRQKFYH